MPKTDKYLAAKVMMRNIAYLADSNGMTDGDIARAMRRTRQTLINRKKNPKSMTVQELIAIADGLGVRPSQLLEPLSPADVPPVFEEETA